MFYAPSLGIWDSMEQNDTISKADNSERLLPTTLKNLRAETYQRSLEKEFDLPDSYQLKPQDIICGNRGSKETYQHVGNERFRIVIDMRLQRYSRSTRRDKSEIVREIVDAVRDYGGRFVRFDAGRWIDIGNLRAREKTGHAIRGALLKHKISVHGKLDEIPDPVPSRPESEGATTGPTNECESDRVPGQRISISIPTFEEFLALDDDSPWSRKRAPEEHSNDDFLDYQRVKRPKSAD